MFRVCLRMFSRAAFASASGAASRAAQAEPEDPDLTGPDRTCPFVFDDDSAAPNVFSAKLPVYGITAPTSLLPPGMGPLSTEWERPRQEVRITLQSLFASSAASGTVRTYEAALRAIAPNVTADLRLRALPMGSKGVFIVFFIAVVLLGPKSPSSLTLQPAVRWSFVKQV